MINKNGRFYCLYYINRINSDDDKSLSSIVKNEDDTLLGIKHNIDCENDNKCADDDNASDSNNDDGSDNESIDEITTSSDESDADNKCDGCTKSDCECSCDENTHHYRAHRKCNCTCDENTYHYLHHKKKFREEYNAYGENSYTYLEKNGRFYY